VHHGRASRHRRAVAAAGAGVLVEAAALKLQAAAEMRDVRIP
jgi:hypothetical protein